MNILLILTSHDSLGDSGEKTGFWLEELAAPYYTFIDAGAQVTLTSPKGGLPPLDPKSNQPEFQTAATVRFSADTSAMQALQTTLPLSTIYVADYDAIFYAGGHGPLWDLAEDPCSISLIEHAIKANKPVAAVCHAPGVFRHTKAADGQFLVHGKSVTGFSNSEEQAVGLTDIVPFLLEDMLKNHGANYSKQQDWQPYVVTDGLLVTGQNPASSMETAQAILNLLSAKNSAGAA